MPLSVGLDGSGPARTMASQSSVEAEGLAGITALVDALEGDLRRARPTPSGHQVPSTSKAEQWIAWSGLDPGQRGLKLAHRRIFPLL
jgi:hypothetical protein